jgi:hypothetical protein
MANRDVNPDQWDQQLRFWSTLLKRWGVQASVIDFSVSELTDALMYDHIYPPLHPSITLLVKTGVLQSRDSALSPPSLMSSIASAVFGFVFPTDPPLSPSYVFRTNLRERAERLVLAITSRPAMISDLCCTKEHLARQDPSVDIELLCAELGRMKHCVERRPLGYFFPYPAFGKPSREVVDGILKIKVGIASLNVRLEKLEEYIADQLQKARAFKGQNRNDQALICLRRKKMAQNMTDHINGVLTQLETALDQIEAGDMNAQTTEAMRQMIAVPVPDREDVEQVLEEAAENAQRQRELSEALMPPPVDEDELERELDEMVAQMPHVREGTRERFASLDR